MKVKNLLDIIDSQLPQQTAIEGDRIGLQIKTGGDDVSNILITMELNDSVINEAITLKCDCIITFHPLIFNPLLQINSDNRVGRLTAALIKNNIALISIHTNFDSHAKGTSRLLCDRLNLTYDGFLLPDKSIESFGMGVVCHSDMELSLPNLLDRLSAVCNSPIRYSNGSSNIINRIGIVGGSGSSFIDEAMDQGLDAFITADVSYHNFHRTEGKMAVIDPGHYEMEQFVAGGLLDLLRDKIDEGIGMRVSGSYTNPVNYFPDNNYSDNQKKYILNKI